MTDSAAATTAPEATSWTAISISGASQRSGPGAGAPVAVRSSAAGEDGAESSFAGQYETVLGVGSYEDLVAGGTASGGSVSLAPRSFRILGAMP